MIANAVIGVMGSDPSPYFATAVLFALSCVMTQFMSNTASCALLAPIGISIAQGMGADPHAVLMAIGVAASCAFGTPVGTPPNTLLSTWSRNTIYRLCKSWRSIDLSLLL